MAASAGGRRAGLPRSTLSRRLAGLERSVGLSLLSRSTRKLALTEAGQLYLKRCRRILAEARLVHEELQDGNAPFEGLLRVNLPAGFATEALAGPSWTSRATIPACGCS